MYCVGSGLQHQARVGFHCVLALEEVVGHHGGLGKTRGEARLRTRRRHGEDADSVPTSNNGYAAKHASVRW